MSFGGATVRLPALKYGYNYLIKANSNYILSSFDKSSRGVFFLYQILNILTTYKTFRLKLISWSLDKILGVDVCMSSRKSVSSKAALLYLSLD